MIGPLWEVITVSLILTGMVAALIIGGDKLDHWTWMGTDPKKPKRIDNPNDIRVYGMTLKQIRKLHVYYVSRTGDTKLENL